MNWKFWNKEVKLADEQANEKILAPEVFRYGFDLGNTLVNKTVPLPDAFRVAKRIVTELDPNAVIISRVNEKQKQRALEWFKKENVLEQLGIKPENVYWCEQRCEKAPIVDKLGLTHFIDDRPEVMNYLSNEVVKIFINPDPSDLYDYRDDIQNFTVCSDWLAIEKLVFSKNFRSYTCK